MLRSSTSLGIVAVVAVMSVHRRGQFCITSIGCLCARHLLGLFLTPVNTRSVAIAKKADRTAAEPNRRLTTVYGLSTLATIVA